MVQRLALLIERQVRADKLSRVICDVARSFAYEENGILLSRYMKED